MSLNINNPPSSNISVHETCPSNYQPVFRSEYFVKNEVFIMFCKDYVQFIHYVNELLTSLSNENIFEKTKIKSLEEEMKKLKNENTTFRESILTQLKIIENLSGNKQRQKYD